MTEVDKQEAPTEEEVSSEVSEKTTEEQGGTIEAPAPTVVVERFTGRHMKITRRIIRRIAKDEDLKEAVRAIQSQAQYLAALQARLDEEIESAGGDRDKAFETEIVQNIARELNAAQRVAEGQQFTLIQAFIEVALDDETDENGNKGASELLDELIADLAGLDGPEALNDAEADVYMETLRALLVSESFKRFLRSLSAGRKILGASLSGVFGQLMGGSPTENSNGTEQTNSST